jgi:hypothetical protein
MTATVARQKLARAAARRSKKEVLDVVDILQPPARTKQLGNTELTQNPPSFVPTGCVDRKSPNQPTLKYDHVHVIAEYDWTFKYKLPLQNITQRMDIVWAAQFDVSPTFTKSWIVYSNSLSFSASPVKKARAATFPSRFRVHCVLEFLIRT